MKGLDAAVIVLIVVAGLARERRPQRNVAEPARAGAAAAGRRRLLRYRLWAGFGLWGAATAIDATLASTTPGWDDNAGALSLLGFLLAFAWSMFDPARS